MDQLGVWMHLNESQPTHNECIRGFECWVGAQGSQSSMDVQWTLAALSRAVGGVFIAHTNKRDRWRRIPNFQGKSERPQAKERSYRPRVNAMPTATADTKNRFTSRWTPSRNDRRQSRGTSDFPGRTDYTNGTTDRRVSRTAQDLQWFWKYWTGIQKSEWPQAGTTVPKIGTSDFQKSFWADFTLVLFLLNRLIKIGTTAKRYDR